VVVFPNKVRILRLNGGIEAVLTVNDAHHDIETVRGANSGKVDPESDLESTGDRGGKRSNFGNVDHSNYDNFSPLLGALKFC